MKEILQDPRKALAYFWSPVCAFLLWYILHRWGDKVEIVTLIIGLIGGTIIGGIFGMYYGASHSRNPITPAGGSQNAETIINNENKVS